MNNEDAHARRICRVFVLSIWDSPLSHFFSCTCSFTAPLPRSTLEGMMMRLSNFCCAIAQEARRSAFHSFQGLQEVGWMHWLRKDGEFKPPLSWAFEEGSGRNRSRKQ